MRAQRLFLYGTLLPQAGTAMGRMLESAIVARRPATVRARLFALPSAQGWYPALVPGGRRSVAGMVCTVRLSAAQWRQLDRYEGPQYRRALVETRDAAGACADAQAWVWRAPLGTGARPIPEGDFLAWLARTGARPFA